MMRKDKATPVQWFDIPVFPIPIYAGKLLLCCTVEEWAAVAITYDSDPDTDGCKGLSIRYRTPDEGRIYAIGIFDEQVDTFVHEIAHATFDILGDVGVTLEDGGANEAFTYLLAWLVREVLPVFQGAVK